jgi:hypothetical protein
MRCLYCDGKLPLYRKIASGQFCSAGHRRQYWKEQERLAVERLSQTHDSLRAYRPEGAATALDAALAANPSHLESLEREAAVQDFARTSSNRDQVVEAGFLRSVFPVASDWTSIAIAPTPVDFIVPERAAVAAAGVGSSLVPVFLPASLEAPPQTASCDVPFAGPVQLASLTVPAAMKRDRHAVKSLEPAAATVGRVVELALTPDKPALLATAPAEIVKVPLPAEPVRVEPMLAEPTPVPVETIEREEPVPPMAAAVAVARCAPRTLAVLPRTIAAVPIDTRIPAATFALGSDKSPARSDTSPVGSDRSEESRVLAAAGILPLPAPAASDLAVRPAQSGVKAAEISVAASAPENILKTGLATPAVPARFRMGNAARYPLSTPPPAPLTESVAPAATNPRPAALPALHLEAVPPGQEPNFAWLAPLPIKAGTPAAPAIARASAAAFTPIYPNGVDPKLPASRLEPVNGSAVPAPPRSLLAFANWTPGDPSQGPWQQATDFWNHAPRDLKLALFAIPVLVGMALHPRLPKVHVTAPVANVTVDHHFQQVLAKQVDTVQQNLANRAAVALSEDFRSGLEDWQMQGDQSAAWSFDSNGFVRPGELALYRPSLRLSDYDLQFLGLIDKKALSFVARAQDFRNYYVIKLVVLKPGPLPTIGVTRYAVIDGKAQHRVDSIAPITAMPDMLYHVDLVVHDDTYLLSLQGKVADTWSEPLLPRGGVGFFSARGEESRVRWVQLTHQYDMLGRLCAYLAPYNIPTTNGSW